MGVTAGPDGGRFNVVEWNPDGSLSQHFNGLVTEYIPKGNGVAVFCGTVEVLQLGTSGNENLFFRAKVVDNGQPNEAPDSINWHRPANLTGNNSCGNYNPDTVYDMSTGNLIVRDTLP